MIEDDELRSLFQVESEEHLSRLEDGLLRLESGKGNQATQEEILREAHSLKGAARMLGLSDIEVLSHRLEDVLRSVSRNQLSLSTAGLTEKLLAAIDALKAMSREALDDTPADVRVPEFIKQFELITSGSSGQSANQVVSQSSDFTEPQLSTEKEEIDNLEPNLEKFPDTVPEFLATNFSTETEAIARASEYHIDTIRVEPKKLDALMTNVGELIVTQKLITQRGVEVNDATKTWEQLNNIWKSLKVRFRDNLNSGENTIEGMLSRDFSIMENGLAQLGANIQLLNNQLSNDIARLDMVSNKLDDGIREVRMLPLSTVFDQFQRMTRDISKAQGKEIDLIIEGGETLADKRIVEEVKDPLMHLIRNAIHHGIEEPAQREAAGKPRNGTIRLSGKQTAVNIEVVVEDDGRGLDINKIKKKAIKQGLYTEEELNEMPLRRQQALIFLSGLSTQDIITDISGRGVGMDVVRNNVEDLKGRIDVSSSPDTGCSFRLELPQTLATTQVILIQVADQLLGVPVEFIETSLRIKPEDIYALEGRSTITIEEQPVSVGFASDLLNLPSAKSSLHNEKKFACVILFNGDERMGLLVDDVVDEQELVLKPPGALLKRVRNVTGVGILGTGQVCMVLNPQDLFRSLQKGENKSHLLDSEEPVRKLVVLLAEDSLITRVQEKRIMEAAGYEVIDAVDGQDAWLKLSKQPVDAVVSDIMMPGLDGFGLTKKIRENKSYEDLPVILVTTLASDEHRRKGMESGANAYITKAGFDQHVFLDTLARLTGNYNSV